MDGTTFEQLKMSSCFFSNKYRGTFAYICHKNQRNVGKCTSHIDPLNGIFYFSPPFAEACF